MVVGIKVRCHRGSSDRAHRRNEDPARQRRSAANIPIVLSRETLSLSDGNRLCLAAPSVVTFAPGPLPTVENIKRIVRTSRSLLPRPYVYR